MEALGQFRGLAGRRCPYNSKVRKEGDTRTCRALLTGKQSPAPAA